MSRKVLEQECHSAFFQAIATSPLRLLLVNYDGVLAPRSADNRRAVPYPEIRDHLQRIMKDCHTRLIAVSGRPAHEVASLLRMQPMPEIWGGDGLERLYRDGRYECADLDVPMQALQALAECESTLRQNGLGKLIQVKLAGVSVHWQGLNDAESSDARAKTRRILRPLADVHASLRFNEFERGAELRLRSANKGDALRRLLAVTPRESPVAYLGDDSTDEDAFRVLNGRGLAVLVKPIPRFTSAQICLQSHDELIRFLNDWIRASSFERL